MPADVIRVTVERVTIKHPGTLLASGAVLVLVSGAVLAHTSADPDAGPRAGLVALDRQQDEADRLDPAEAFRLVVDPASTRLLVHTAQGDHFVARTPTGELCLLRVPEVRSATQVCVADRVGADVTIGTEGAGQVRLTAGGAPPPQSAEGWHRAGPDVWVRD